MTKAQLHGQPIEVGDTVYCGWVTATVVCVNNPERRDYPLQAKCESGYMLDFNRYGYTQHGGSYIVYWQKLPLKKLRTKPKQKTDKQRSLENET